MHVYYPCPTIEVAGIGGMNLTSDGISFLRTRLLSHTLEFCPIFFSGKKLSYFSPRCLPLLKSKKLFIGILLSFFVILSSDIHFFSQLSVSIDPVYSLKSRICSLKMSLKVLEFYCGQPV